MTWAEATKDIVEAICGLIAIIAIVAGLLDSRILPWNGTKRKDKDKV